jgi:hypothetical protein
MQTRSEIEAKFVGALDQPVFDENDKLVTFQYVGKTYNLKKDGKYLHSWGEMDHKPSWTIQKRFGYQLRQNGAFMHIADMSAEYAQKCFGGELEEVA